MSAPTTPNKSQYRSAKLKPRTANFYNKDDILKNKVEHRGIPSAKVLLKTIETRKVPSEQKYYDFFNTQVNPEYSHT